MAAKYYECSTGINEHSVQISAKFNSRWWNGVNCV